MAEQIDASPRPLPNPRLAETSALPDEPPALPAASPEAASLAGFRPRPNPRLSGETLSVAPETGLVLASSPRPLPRPAALTRRLAELGKASAAAGLDLSSGQATAPVEVAADKPLTRKERRKKKREEASMEGAVCGVPAIKGEPVAPITSNVEGCGIADPVRVTSVAGVRLSQAATVDCSIATALNTWVQDVVQPAYDGKVSELRVAAHYVCRGRNNKKGAKISEHGKGRAIDISAFILTDGRVLSVLQDYDSRMRRVYKAGCGIFRTTLGPGSDGYHEDHLHFDTSARSGGAYCR